MNREEAFEWCTERNDIEIRFEKYSIIARLLGYPSNEIVLSRTSDTFEQAVTRLAEAMRQHGFS